MSIDYSAPDLTRHPPRSPRVRLGGLVHLPRLLDKARAHAAGRAGNYIYPCPLDHRLFSFFGLDADAFLAAVATGRSDHEMLAWVHQNARLPRAPHEIAAWSHWLEHVAPGDARRHATFGDEITRLAPAREDIVTTFDRLDLDDFVSFGGQGG